MRRHFAQVSDSVVERVVVATSKEWCEQRLGGEWVETIKYDGGEEQYAGIGMGFDPEHEAKFAPPWRAWDGVGALYVEGERVFHNGKIWTSLLDNNVWEPGVTGWRDKEVEYPDWIQPKGAHDVYNLGDRVTHKGFRWESTLGNNVWEPGGNTGWVQI